MASGKVVKAIIAAVFLGIAAALFLYSCVTPIFYTTGPDGMSVTLWKLCVKKDGETLKCLEIAYDCEEQHDRFSSARAFNIITIIIIIVGFLFACLEAFRYKTLKWRVIFSLMAFISGLVSWSIALIFFTTKHCQLFGTAFAEKEDARLGASVPAQFIAWFFVIFSICIEVLDPKKWSRCCSKKKSGDQQQVGEDHSPTSENLGRTNSNNNNNSQKNTGSHNNNNNNHARRKSGGTDSNIHITSNNRNRKNRRGSEK